MRCAILNTLVVLLTTTVCLAQPAKDMVVAEVLRANEFMNKPAEILTKAFGEPDDKGEDAEVWTYIIRSPEDENNVLGYRQFGFWGDTVAGYTVRWFTSDEEAAQLFSATLGHLGADGHTVMQLARPKDDSLFTENLTMARRGDNLWYADKAPEGEENYAAIMVAGMEYKGGHWLMRVEGRRVEARLK